MPAVNLIVCEQHGKWATALRRAVGPRVELRETRSLSECGRELTQRRTGVIALELTAQRVARVAEFVVWLGEFFPETRPVVLANRRLASLEWWLRELGAAHFVTSPRQLQPLAEVAARQALRLPPSPSLSWSDKFWAQLPWAN